MFKTKLQKINRRHNRVRAKISGTSEMPRLAVSKSNRNLVAQVIDDTKGETLAYAWTKMEKGANLREKSVAVGKRIAELAKAKNVEKVAFDRGGYKYTGNIAALADAAREGGLKF